MPRTQEFCTECARHGDHHEPATCGCASCDRWLCDDHSHRDPESGERFCWGSGCDDSDAEIAR